MKYTFVRGALASVVWDPDNSVALAEFVGGKFTTKDTEVAKKLHGMGYKDITEYPDGPPPGGFEPLADASSLKTGDIVVPKTEAASLLKNKIEEDAKDAVTDDDDDDDDEDNEEEEPVVKKKKKKKVLKVKRKKPK